MAPTGPMSPCINICSLDEQGYCRGCYRSREEIAAWTCMTPAQQWAVQPVLSLVPCFWDLLVSFWDTPLVLPLDIPQPFRVSAGRTVDCVGSDAPWLIGSVRLRIKNKFGN